jgi:hypothetical protein
MMTQLLPPPFMVGETYLDRQGEYVVVAVTGGRITLRREDGRQVEADASVKARIHRNLLAEHGEHPTLQNRKIRFEGRRVVGFRLSEVFPVIAATIRSLSATRDDFVNHEDLVAALVGHPELKAVLTQLAQRDPQGNQPCGGRATWSLGSVKCLRLAAQSGRASSLVGRSMGIGPTLWRSEDAAEPGGWSGRLTPNAQPRRRSAAGRFRARDWEMVEIRE